MENSKKKPSLLKDNSWIKKSDNDEKAVDSNSNYGRSVLNRYRSAENLFSSKEGMSTTVTSSTTSLKKSSVQTLSKKFSASQDQLDSKSTTATTIKNDTRMAVSTRRSSDLKSPTKSEIFTVKGISDVKSTTVSKTQVSKTTETTTKSVSKTQAVTVSATKNIKVQNDSTTVKSQALTTSKDTIVKDDVKALKSVTSAVSKETTVKDDVKAVKTVASAVSKETIVKDDVKAIKSVTSATSKETIVKDDVKAVKTVASAVSKETIVKDDVKAIKSVTSATSKETIVKDDTRAVKSVTSPTSTIKTISSQTTIQAPESKTTSYSVSSKYRVEEQLGDTLTPTSIKSIQSTPDSSHEKSRETSSSTYTRKSYKEIRNEDYPSGMLVTETNVSSKPESDVWSSTKTYTTRTYTESSAEDLIDTYSSRSLPTVYTSIDRKITDKDLCTFCHKPVLSDTKMIIEDMNIMCHASCFKCDVCQNSLGHLKAGDSMWLYRQAVHCESCFATTKSKWHR